MNTYIKMISRVFTIVAVFVALFAVSNKAFAGASFNTDPQDCPTVSIANYTQGTGSSAPCWPTSITANPGDVINVRIYYHNTGNQAASSTFVKLSSVQSAPQSTYTFTGSVFASNAYSAYGSATLVLPSAQSLVLGTVEWYPDQAYVGTQPPFGQNGHEMFANSGLGLGTINPGWNTQGSVSVTYKVSNYIAPQPTTYQCNDGIDNDGDGLVDYPQDPGCSNATDTNEYSIPQPVVYQCNDGVDNDGDGLTDYPQDPGCTAPTDNTEYNAPTPTTYQCNDGIDNDGDGLTDYPQDPGCAGFTDTAEYNAPTPTTYQCNDGIDNDGDGLVDYPQDPGCASWNDTTESPNPYIPPVQNPPTAVTTVATGISQTSAVLNGLVLAQGNVPATTWFEYGTTSYLGGATNKQNVYAGASMNVSDAVSGLTPSTTYYFRVVAQNQSGIAYGAVKTFITPSVQQQTSNIVYVNTYTGGSGSPKIVLKVESPFENACVGDTNTYTVTYKNVTKTTFKNVILRIILPPEIVFKRSSNGVFNLSDNSITLDIGTMVPAQEGVLVFDGILKKPTGTDGLLVVTATMAYTNPNNTQENTIAYGLTDVSQCSNTSLLGAAALFGFGFLPNSLLGWLLLTLLILLIVYLARRYRSTTTTNTNTKQTTTTTTLE